jgi:transcriptional regulator with XRE-family HTH domain
MDLPAYRKQHKLTLATMARRCGCSAAQLSRIEAGKSRASIELAQRIVEETAGDVALAELRPDLAAAFGGEAAA